MRFIYTVIAPNFISLPRPYASRLMKPFLPFIADVVFLSIVKDVLDTGSAALCVAETNMHRNVIDPFARIFEMACFGLDAGHWENREKTRQSQKTLSNKTGLFHQKLIGSINGWEDLGTKSIVDVVNHDRKIIAEIKNKHNTVKKSDLIGVYKKLHDIVMHKTQVHKGYTAYYVEIIPRKPERYNQCLTPSDNETGEKIGANDLVRQIDGASFYALATGIPDALNQVYYALLCAIEQLQPTFSVKEKKRMAEYFMRAYG